MLQKIFGNVLPNYRFEIGTLPDDYQYSALFPSLSKIFQELQHYRNFTDFVKARYVDVDYFIPDPGFIVEFDESQHFTIPRRLTLEHYPNQPYGFSIQRWRQLCMELQSCDNDPPYRDEQRAWYDTLRDFLPEIKGLRPTVRLYARDLEWCQLNPENENDIERFKQLLNLDVTEE